METVDFSVPIFVDGGSVLVRDASKFTRLADLKGKRVAVIPGTTTEQALARTLSALGAPATLVPVEGLPPRGSRAARRRPRRRLAGDRIVLTTLRAARAERARHRLPRRDFSYEPYALVLPRDDPDFRLP